MEWLYDSNMDVGDRDLELCDIGMVYRAILSPGQCRDVIGMEAIMRELGIRAQRLFNGGNDARYNPLVMLSMLEHVNAVGYVIWLAHYVRHIGWERVENGDYIRCAVR